MAQETAAKPPSRVFSIHGGGGKPSSTVKNAPPPVTPAAKPHVITPKPAAVPPAKRIDRPVSKVSARVTARRR